MGTSTRDAIGRKDLFKTNYFLRGEMADQQRSRTISEPSGWSQPSGTFLKIPQGSGMGRMTSTSSTLSSSFSFSPTSSLPNQSARHKGGDDPPASEKECRQ